MKKCTYCGKEYPDDAEVCGVDQARLESCDPAQRHKQPGVILDSRRARPASIFGPMSIATPLIGGVLLLMLWRLVDARIGAAIMQHQIAHPGVGFSMDTGELYLAMSIRVLIPAPIIGIGFGVLARKRQEPWTLPIIGFFLNLVAILFLIAHIVLFRILGRLIW